MLAFDPHFDLAVVGGGPAGASAAITFARNGGRTLLLEAKSFPRHKVCGEFISAESLDVLSSLLRDSPTGRELIKSAPTIRETRLYHGNRMIQAPVSPPALSIARYRLDAVLWEAAKAEGVEALAACEVTAVAGNGPFRLTTSQGQYEANALIIAAGRWSLFTSNRSVPAGPKWIGVKGHFHEADPSFTTDLYFFDHGYCGVQPVSDGIVNACAMVRSDRAASLAEVFKLHPRLAERAAEWEAVAQPVSTAPLVYRRPEPTAGNRLFAGDAAALCPTSYNVTAEAKLAIWPPTLVCLLARNTIIIGIPAHIGADGALNVGVAGKLGLFINRYRIDISSIRRKRNVQNLIVWQY